MPIVSSDLVGHKRWARVHKRAFGHHGCIVDIGCEGWEWSKQFLGRKPVVGYGPGEANTPDGAILHPRAIGACAGSMTLYGQGQDASCVPLGGSANTVEMISLAAVIRCHSPISVLKMNIERMEYAILPMVEHPVADQLVVSFHDREPVDAWRKPWTQATVTALSQWYEPIKIHGQWNWWLFLAHRELIPQNFDNHIL